MRCGRAVSFAEIFSFAAVSDSPRLSLGTVRTKVANRVGRRPTGEQLESFVRGRARLGGLGQEQQAAVCREVHCFVGQVEISNDGMVDTFAAGAVFPDIV